MKTCLIAVSLMMFSCLSIVGAQENCPHKALSPVEATPSTINRLLDVSDNVNAIMTDASDTPEQARRFEVFRFEKDYHAKNVLHYGMKVNLPSCTIAKKENGAPGFSNYWIMGEEDGRVKNMTSDDLKRLGPIVLNQDEHQVTFKMPAFQTVPIRKKEVRIEANIVNGACKVTGSIETDNGHRVDITKIFAAMSSFIGIPTGVNSLDVEGTDRTTGAPIKLHFNQ